MPPRGARARIYQAAVRLFAANGSDEITVSDLAETAGIARGTIYNNIQSPETLFGDVAGWLSHEMILRTEAAMGEITSPVERLATGTRLFIRRAHEEHDWGLFLVRFGLNHAALHAMMHEPPARDIRAAIDAGAFKTSEDKIPALVSMLTGATLAAMGAVIRGDQAWRDAASAAAEFFLRAGGLAGGQARYLATRELPDLAAPAVPSQSRAKRKKS